MQEKLLLPGHTVALESVETNDASLGVTIILFSRPSLRYLSSILTPRLEIMQEKLLLPPRGHTVL
jgi:hypothetical protein